VITVGAWLVAVVLRLGVWPLTGPLVDALDRADGAGAVALALPVGGLAIVVRSAHETAGLWSGTGALVTVVLGCALVAALLSSVQGPWRRGLGYALSALHALLFAACLDATEAGFLGGELLWSGVLVASSGAMLSVMVVEARTGPLDLRVWHGLHDRMRFLSALTLVFALGAAGLPGSIVFIAEELLLSGSASDGAIGAILVLSTLAAIGYNLVRMHFHVFFGPPTVPGAARALDHLDATGRERAAMLLLVLPLFGAGLAPRTVPLLGEGAAPADEHGAAAYERGAPEPAALP
jgi:NADH:ubiquinone oxidoreductase subunit 4 (subunit M)